MFAVNHALTAVAVRRAVPEAPLWPLLLSVQAVEILWVILHLVGVEHVVIEPVVRSVADVHLDHMPWSHSFAGIGAVAMLGGVAAGWRWGRRVGVAVAVGVLSHLLLDLVTHAPDLALAPGLEGTRFGTGLYVHAPWAAVAVEMGWGLCCWWLGGRGRALLALALLGNLANLSVLVPDVPGPEALFAGRPALLVAVIAVQIAVTLLLVGKLAGRPEPSPAQDPQVEPATAGA
ncbi:hypothetical protein [Vulgatibacter sp.]|uniref:hypothetical protein n=1 Tax=Vulgatibacter sp. TaxID=1971226 RepID=UPI0035648AF1